MCSPSAAQSGTDKPSGSSNCTLADFEILVDFAAGSGHSSVILKQRNTSAHNCVLDRDTTGPAFVGDIGDHPPIGFCYGCEIDGMRLPTRSLTLEPGQVAVRTYRWKTKGTEQECIQPTWIPGPVMVIAPSLVKSVCSGIEISRFQMAAPSDSQGEIDNPAALKLSSGKSVYYQGEDFPLRVALGDVAETAVEDETCPTLYVWHRSPDGTTRVDEIQPRSLEPCARTGPGHRTGDWRSGFDLPYGMRSRVAELGEHELQVLQLTGSAGDGVLHLLSSNILRFQLMDPATIQRKWGLSVRGVAADLTLDKTTYKLGEDVPLHLALENFNAQGEVYGDDPLWDPCFVLAVQVFAKAGQPLSPADKFPTSRVCMGHGRGLIEYKKGKVVPLESSLGSRGELPNRPGTYTVVVIWTPVISPTPLKTVWPPDPKLKVRVQAAATIHIEGGGS